MSRLSVWRASTASFKTRGELAAQYCLARSLEAAGYAYLRNARNCYDRWGALGKVKQLNERYPRLHEGRLPSGLYQLIVYR